MGKSILIVGLGGIGKTWLDEAVRTGSTIYTVDPKIQPNTPDRALHQYVHHYETLDKLFVTRDLGFDVAIIATPNHLHEEHVRRVGRNASVIFVEKPGLRSTADWVQLYGELLGQGTYMVMVKNNYYRAQMLRNLTEGSLPIKQANFLWLNKDRMPPEWSQKEDLAFGGVSRDLMPHLINSAQAIFGTHLGKVISSGRCKLWNFSKTGGVDDHAWIQLELSGTVINLIAAWKTDWVGEDTVRWGFKFDDAMPGLQEETSLVYNAGLCPNQPYREMLREALQGDMQFQEQFDLDIVTHSLMEKIPMVTERDVPKSIWEVCIDAG